MPENPTVISLKTEQIAWDTLKAILNNEIDMSTHSVSFKEADWVNLHLKFEGAPFNQTTLPSIMKGMVDFQNSFYRAAALLTKNDGRITRLSDEEKDAYELVFKVSGGSSDFFAPVKEILEKLVEPLTRGLGPKQKFTLIIVISVLMFTEFGWSNYITQVSETKKSSDQVLIHQSDNAREIGVQELAAKHAEEDHEKFKILNEAFKQVRRSKVVADEAFDGFDSIIRQSRKADNVQVQGRSVSKGQISEITKSQRRPSEKLNFRALYTIDRVEPIKAGGFYVKIKNTQTAELVTALLEERFARERYGRVIQRAEWGKTIVSIQISGKRIGNEITDAKILAAHRPRQRKRR